MVSERWRDFTFLMRRKLPTVRRYLELSVRGFATVLDVGGGDGRHWSDIWQNDQQVTVLDISVEDLQTARHQPYGPNVLRGHVLHLPVRDASFDLVLCASVIEHVDRDLGGDLIRELERVARRRVVILTPSGFMPQEPSISNPWQQHLSGWVASDFQLRGYKVVGVGGPKVLRGRFHIPRLRPMWFSEGLSALVQPLVKHLPAVAASILAVKDLDVAPVSPPQALDRYRR